MSYSIDSSPARPAAPTAGRRVARCATFCRAVFGMLLLPVVASCDNGNYGYCYNCGVPPTEISQGVVTGNFNGTSFASPSVVALSALQPWTPGSGNLKVYLATGPGAFASPVYVADGDNPPLCGERRPERRCSAGCGFSEPSRRYAGRVLQRQEQPWYLEHAVGAL